MNSRRRMRGHGAASRAWPWVLLLLAAIMLSSHDSAPGALVREPYLQLGTPTSMTIVWRTRTPTTTRVRYGAAGDRLRNQVVDHARVVDHRVTLRGLAPDSRYFYDVGTATTLLAGGDDDHFFATSPISGSSRRFTAWVLADSGDGSSDQRDVLASMQAERAGLPLDLILHLGDLAYDAGTDMEFTSRFFGMYREVLRETVFWPSLGNHDADGSRVEAQAGPYFDAFVLPARGEAGGEPSGTEAYYSFDYANVHFVALDTSAGDLSASSPMLEWMERDLESTSQSWLVAFWHHPPYSKGTHDSDDPIDSGGRMVAVRENFLPTLEAHGVDLVLSGHSHTYERSFLIDGVYGFGRAPDFATPGRGELLAKRRILDAGNGSPRGDGVYTKPDGPGGGTVYVVAGTGGKSVGGSGGHPVMYASEAEFGSCLLTVDGHTLTLRYLPEGSGRPDGFTIVKR